MKNLDKKFKQISSIKDESRLGRFPITTYFVKIVQGTVAKCLKSSTRRVNWGLAYPRSTVWKTIRYHFNKYTYHNKTMHELEEKGV